MPPPPPQPATPPPPPQPARKEWPEPLLWQAIGMRRGGIPYSTISAILSIPPSTLFHAWKRYEKTGQVKAAARSGRPKKTTARDDRRLLVASRRERRSTYEQLRQGCAVDVSVSTVKRRLGAGGVCRRRAC